MTRYRKPLLFAIVLLLPLLLFTACKSSPATLIATDIPYPPGMPVEDQPADTDTPTRTADDSQLDQIETPTEPPTSSDATPSIDEFFANSWREIVLRDPEWVLADGLAQEFSLQDAKLTDISPEYMQETISLYQTTLNELREYDRAALSPDQQISYDVYEWYLEDQIQGANFLYDDYPATYYPVTAIHQGIFYFFTDLHPVANAQDARDYVTRLSQVDTKLEQLIDGLKLRDDRGVTPPRFAIQWGIYGLENLLNAPPQSTPFYQALQSKLNGLEDLSAEDKQALLGEAEEIIAAEILPAYDALLKHFQYQEGIASEEIGVWQHENGTEYYNYLIHHYTTTDMTADQIHQLGLSELDRIHAEMRMIFDELGYPDNLSLAELYDLVGQDAGTIPANQVFSTYEAIIDQANQNLSTAFDLRPVADVVVISSPIKGMYVSGSLDGSRPGAFHAGPGDSDEQYYAMPTLAYHEAVPGHHFQIALAQESDLPLFRNMIGFSGYAEGWALYAELLASELGWYETDPYGDLGRLQAEAFRATRLAVDTGIHTKGWAYDQAVQFFTENTGFEKGDAVNPEYEIARYSVWPGQSIAYKIGMIKFLELRQRAIDQLGDQFDLKEFHTLLLSNGSMPLEVLEKVVDRYIETRSQ